LLTAEYLDLRSALLRSLKPFPDAARAVAATLHQVEERAAQRPPQRTIDITPQRVANGGAHAG